jgi:hypothetical protein
MKVCLILLLMATTLAMGSSYQDNLMRRRKLKKKKVGVCIGDIVTGYLVVGKGEIGRRQKKPRKFQKVDVCMGDIGKGYLVDGKGTKKASNNAIAGDSFDLQETIDKGTRVLIKDAFIGASKEWYVNRDTGDKLMSEQPDPDDPYTMTFQFTEDESYSGKGSLLISNRCNTTAEADDVSGGSYTQWPCEDYKGYIEFTPKESRELTVGDFYSFSFRYKVKTCAASGPCAYIYLSMYTHTPGDPSWYTCRFTLQNEEDTPASADDGEWYEFYVDRESPATVNPVGVCTSDTLDGQTSPLVNFYEARTNNPDHLFIAVNFGDTGASDNGMEIYVDYMIFATKKAGEQPVYEVIDIEPFS